MKQLTAIFLSLLGLAFLLGGCSSGDSSDEQPVPLPDAVSLSQNSYLELTWSDPAIALDFYAPFGLNTGDECEFQPEGGFSDVYNLSLVTGTSGTQYELYDRSAGDTQRIQITPDIPDGTYFLYFNNETVGTAAVPFNWQVRYFQGPDTLINSFGGTQMDAINTLCDPFYNLGISMVKVGSNVSFQTFTPPPAPAQPDTLELTQSQPITFTLTDSSRIALDEPTPSDAYDIGLAMTYNLDQDLCACNASCLLQFTFNLIGVFNGPTFFDFTPRPVAGNPSREYINFPAGLPDGTYYIYFVGTSTFAKPFILQAMTDQTNVAGSLVGAFNFPGRCLNENVVGYRTRIQIVKTGTSATLSVVR